jgi:hypothetical protein
MDTLQKEYKKQDEMALPADPLLPLLAAPSATVETPLAFSGASEGVSTKGL